MSAHAPARRASKGRQIPLLALRAGVVFLLMASAAPAFACNVPVFRYALERWLPDPYQLIVYQPRPLSAAEQAELNLLHKYLEAENCPVNVTLQQVDATRLLKAFSAPAPFDRPWMVLHYPEHAHIDTPVYQGPLDGATIKRLLDSPARRAIARRILQGESVVWVLLDSGDKPADDAAHERLQKNLTELAKTLKLPELSDSPKDKLLATTLEMKIAFSVVRITADNEEEQVLRRMLVNLEDDTAQRKEPMVFPVFGRGMAMFGLVGKGINEENIAGAARFLTDKCSCEVKRLNPGVDLLMTAAWQESLGGTLATPPELPPLTGLLKPAVIDDAPEPAGSEIILPPVVRTPASSSWIWLYLGGTLAVAFTGLGVATWFILRKT